MPLTISVEEMKDRVKDVSVDAVILGSSAKLQGKTAVSDLCDAVMEGCMEVEKLLTSIMLAGVRGVHVIKAENKVTTSFYTE